MLCSEYLHQPQHSSLLAYRLELIGTSSLLARERTAGQEHEGECVRSAIVSELLGKTTSASVVKFDAVMRSLSLPFAHCISCQRAEEW